ncbi:hypothetical protein OSB04_019381 [Centaurea solstitialis]|uniref:Uncharacterized protein n=1 Tax=Centaurea solstitialis TaxID=347529 RepID=A0AA38SQR2_9ASTR|nr:hypothetical protein OSB04_019381 [Centaurea solstitialis]
MKLLQEYSLSGSFGSLYESIAKLDDSYIMHKQTKDAILNPKLPNYGDFIPLLFPNETVPKVNKLQRVVLCEAEEFIAAGNGFMKDEVAYMIKDDLEVKPWSLTYTLTTLSEFGLEDYDDLEEKVVSLGMKEGMMLLKASFECKEVLTTVFLVE